MAKLNVRRGVAAGVVGTAAITMLMLGALLMGPSFSVGR
jgi:hypothetical protein